MHNCDLSSRKLGPSESTGKIKPRPFALSSHPEIVLYSFYGLETFKVSINSKVGEVPFILRTFSFKSGLQDRISVPRTGFSMGTPLGLALTVRLLPSNGYVNPRQKCVTEQRNVKKDATKSLTS